VRLKISSCLDHDASATFSIAGAAVFHRIEAAPANA
jgi:hypothetical protein